MKILIILGSIRQPSLTRILAERAATAYADRGMSVDWVDPRARPLPIADPNYHHDVADTPDANPCLTLHKISSITTGSCDTQNRRVALQTCRYGLNSLFFDASG
ncbi:MAG: NAD(P)H-dependent oxidoreductase, partial [Gammaproteobacteria bacterium]|nr:NAD(P)H-dependent oxidoreductase [Gammaproteobacteria bacterium]